jgi:hypothetical protein
MLGQCWQRNADHERDSNKFDAFRWHEGLLKANRYRPDYHQNLIRMSQFVIV